MNTHINKEVITDFLFDLLPPEEMSFVADSIVIDKDLNSLYQQVKTDLLSHLHADGELSVHERVDFEFRLRTDQMLAKKTCLLKELNNSMESFKLKNMLEGICQDNETQRELCIVHMPPNKQYKNWLAAASVSVLILLTGGVTYLFQNRDSVENRLYASYYEPFTKNKNEFVLNSSALSEAQQKYLKGDYKAALVMYQNLPSALLIETERDFFVGLSLMELGQYNEAMPYFTNILNNDQYPEYKPKVKWYMALCYMKINNKDEALRIFQSIVDENAYNYKEAKKILRKLS